MGRWLARLAGAVALSLVFVFVVFLVGMRTKAPAVLDRVRRLNRNVTNPRVMRRAGSPGAPAVIRHVGRRSGNSYETPVGPFAVGDDFVIALPYGPDTDWVRNLVAAGSAELVNDGQTLTVTRPEVVPIAVVIGDLPRSEQRVLRIFGVQHAIRVHGATAPAGQQ